MSLTRKSTKDAEVKASAARQPRLATVASPEKALAGIVKGEFERREFSVSPIGLAGAQYHKAYQVWDKFPIGANLELRLEPTNPHDKHAVQVLVDDEMLGYVEKSHSARIASCLGMGMEYNCTVVQKDGQQRPYHQVKLQVSFILYVRKGALNLVDPNRLQYWGEPPQSA
jgi:hypothetical protein